MKTNFFGLDVGNQTIKIAFLRKEKEKYFLYALGEAKTQGELSTPNGEVKAAEAVKRLMGDLEIKERVVVSALPESAVISRVLSFPPMKEEEVYRAIFYEAETFVPYPLNKVQIDYQVIEKTPRRSLVFVVAAPKELIKQRTSFLQSVGLVPLALETTATALARVFGNETGQPVMILDIGAKSSTMLVTKNKAVYLTRSLPFGGEAFTRAIALSLGMDPLKAEEYKKAYGFLKEEWEGKIRKAMEEIFLHLLEEVKKGLLTFKEEWNEEIKVLIVSGGGALMPGLTDELVNRLGIEVQIGQPLEKVEKTPQAKMVISEEKELPKFAVAIGLAMRE
ncbi:type IV pilus assembly protein PilM [bacterium]|nr:type IV pilus assembly protein PilM [bacterium]